MYLLIYWFCCWSPVVSFKISFFFSFWVLFDWYDFSKCQLPQRILFTLLTNRKSAFFFKWFLKIMAFCFLSLTVLYARMAPPFSALFEFMNEWRCLKLYIHTPKPSQSHIELDMHGCSRAYFICSKCLNHEIETTSINDKSILDASTIMADRESLKAQLHISLMSCAHYNGVVVY